jgi:serine/threonine protein kinase
MDTAQLCMGCMQPKEGDDDAACPHCGYRNQPRNPMVLPYQAILNNKFLIGRVLGSPGGFGVTYLAWDTVLHTSVAIKEYFPRHLTNRDPDHCTIVLQSEKVQDQFKYGLKQFLDEARTLAKFSHPNVVRVREFFEQYNTAYLVMDYYEGVSLEEFVQRKGGRISEHLAFNYMLPILDGLRAVHQKNVLHRDIKPANIYITKGDVPILLDFGAARQAIGQKSQTLSVILTAGFAPFEQYLDEPGDLIGPWTDIYACGATLYAITTGIMPQTALNRHQKDTLASPIQIVPTLTPQLSRAIMAALALDPEQRPQNVEAFQHLLLSNQPIYTNQPASLTGQSASTLAAQDTQQTAELDKTKVITTPQHDSETIQKQTIQNQTVDKTLFETQAIPSTQEQEATVAEKKQTPYVRCPHCKARNTVAAGQVVSKLHCQQCGKRIGSMPDKDASSGIGWKTILAIPVLVFAAVVMFKNDKAELKATADATNTTSSAAPQPTPIPQPLKESTSASKPQASTEIVLSPSPSLTLSPAPVESPTISVAPTARQQPESVSQREPHPFPEFAVVACEGKSNGESCFTNEAGAGTCRFGIGEQLGCIPLGHPPPSPH